MAHCSLLKFALFWRISPNQWLFKFISFVSCAFRIKIVVTLLNFDDSEAYLKTYLADHLKYTCGTTYLLQISNFSQSVDFLVVCTCKHVKLNRGKAVCQVCNKMFHLRYLCIWWHLTIKVPLWPQAL